MQNSLEKSQESLDERANSLEDSPMMTIDYLRTRLLSERLVSKAAKERADELAKRVEKLEEQLKIVSFQRKRAEKATLEVLSFLASHGIGDISEVYESDSDQGESLSESNEGKCDATQEDESFGSFKTKGDNEASGSDCDSTTSSGRALSWKGRKGIAQLYDKKFPDFSVRRRASSAHLASSQRHRTGKSCRQIKRREMRSMVEESGHDSTKSDAQDNRTVDSSENVANSLDAREEELGRFPEKQVERFVQKNEVSLSVLPQAQERRSRSPLNKHECNGEMERALEHQAQLIGRYEAEEKAQRDWEEKYGETNISTPDSCEPGNHSDVTEERDEHKETVPIPTEVVACHGHDLKTGTEADLQGKESSIHHFNSFKFSPHPDPGCSQTHICTETQASSSRSLVPDFSFSTAINSYQTYEHGVPPSFHSSPHCARSASPNSFHESEIPDNLNRHRELVSKQEPQKLGAILGALEEAKLLIKQQMNVPPVTSSMPLRKATEDSGTWIKDAAWFKVPVGCPGLFRVPINLQSQAPIQSRLLGSDHTSELTNSSLYSRASLSQHDRYISSPIDTRIDVPRVGTFSGGLGINSEPSISSGQPRFDFVFNTITSHSSSSELASPSYPSFRDFFQGMPSKQTSFSPVLRDEAGIPPSISTLYYDNGVRAEMYR